MSLLSTPAKKIIREQVEGISEVSVIALSDKVFKSVFPEAFVVTYSDPGSGPNHYFVSASAPGKYFQEHLIPKLDGLRETLSINGFSLLGMKVQEAKGGNDKVTEKFYIKLNEATWHQSKSKVKLYSPDTWNVVTDPPNEGRSIMSHKTKEDAERYMSNLAKNNPYSHKHSYVLPPGGIRVPKG
jgi:hypothetical protein